MSVMNSFRVRMSLRKVPVKAEVVVTEFCFWTPRTCMHIWAASMTTATPSGCSVYWMQSRIWTVRRSWT